MADKGNIMPFGKHKGRLIEEVLVDDPSYLQWLTGQDWFRTKHITLYQVIINRGAEPEETPEHNALQVLFLDDAFCLRLMRVVIPGFCDHAEGYLECQRLEWMDEIEQSKIAKRKPWPAKNPPRVIWT
jgi:uncharacterized protein (DUF3820 family)